MDSVSSNGSAPTATAARPGRPRSEAARLAVLDAATDLALAEGCVPTLDAVATRAGVSRTTVYKWWPSVAAVLAEGLFERFHESIEFDDTVPVRDAVTLQVDALVNLLRTTPAGELLRQLLAASASSPDLAHALLTQWLEPRRERAARHLERGIATGELRPDIAVALVVDTLFAPVYHRLVWGHARLDVDLAQRVCALVWPSITHPSLPTTKKDS